VIYTDPPWKQSKGGLRKSRPNQGKSLDYDTISIEEIQSIQRSFMPEQDHVVFMWTIDKYLHESETMMKELGYRLHARIIWDKENGVAPAFTIRYSHEYLLWFYKNKLLPINAEQRGKYTTVIREKATSHSVKPKAAYEMIERLYPDQPKIELFARNLRFGWSSWGKEVPKQICINIEKPQEES